MLLEHELHLTRIDVETARDDQLLDPAADGQAPRLVDLADVACAEPSVVGESFRSGLRVAPVAGENLATLEPDLVLLAELDFDAREWKPDAAGTARSEVRVGHNDPALSDAVTLDRRLAEQA